MVGIALTFYTLTLSVELGTEYSEEMRDSLHGKLSAVNAALGHKHEMMLRNSIIGHTCLSLRSLVNWYRPSSVCLDPLSASVDAAFLVNNLADVSLSKTLSLYTACPSTTLRK